MDKLKNIDTWSAAVILIIVISLAIALCGCGHNQLMRVNGWAVTVQGVFVGECTVLNGKDNIAIVTGSSSGDTAQNFTFKVGEQTSGYDVELAGVNGKDQ